MHRGWIFHPLGHPAGLWKILRDVRNFSLFSHSGGCLVPPPPQAVPSPATAMGHQLSPSYDSCPFLLPFLIVLWSLLGVKLLVFLLIVRYRKHMPPARPVLRAVSPASGHLPMRCLRALKHNLPTSPHLPFLSNGGIFSVLPGTQPQNLESTLTPPHLCLLLANFSGSDHSHSSHHLLPGPAQSLCPALQAPAPPLSPHTICSPHGHQEPPVSP